jgi:hypothetical protein
VLTSQLAQSICSFREAGDVFIVLPAQTNSSLLTCPIPLLFSRIFLFQALCFAG